MGEELLVTVWRTVSVGTYGVITSMLGVKGGSFVGTSFFVEAIDDVFAFDELLLPVPTALSV
jgi:hypothetical protein